VSTGMRRTPLLVLSGAVAGFAGLIGWHSLAGAPASLAGRAAPAAGGPAGKAAGGTSGAAGKPAGAGKPARAGGAVRTVTGPLENFGYGTIAVRVTVRGSQVIAASVTTLTTLEPTSQQICAQAIPVLRSEVLAAHSANINGVSGATYTSVGYYRSLQAALHKLQAG
jgi:uncharacterized protein with FMN-binding domain